jgi:hypothetical protein
VVDILQGAPVNAPATGGSNQRKSLPGSPLRPRDASGDGALTRSDGWLYGPYKYKLGGRSTIT